jgi:hypothetical protein
MLKYRERKKMTAETVLSLTAIIISLFSIYLQYVMVEGAEIAILNDEDNQRSVPRPYSGLPKNIQDNFPDYPDEQPGYALIKLVFGNSGDRTGIAKIKGVKAFIEGGHHIVIKPSYYSYTLVPAYDIVEKDILLRNILLVPYVVDIAVEVTIEHGGYHPRISRYLRKGFITKTLHISLIPASENPWDSI